MIDFMREDIENNGAFILFDGHRIISSSKSMEFAELGYDSKRRFMNQINLMYIFSLSENSASPAFYKQYIGSTLDVSAFPDILKESGAETQRCTIVGDKGVSSEDDLQRFDNDGLQYIFPLRRGNRFSKKLIPITPETFSDTFNYNRRAIKATKIEEENFNVFVFMDLNLYENELSDAVERRENNNKEIERRIKLELERRRKGNGKLSDEEFKLLIPKETSEIYKEIPEMGTITVRTNRKDLNSEQVYRVYKQRQNIEQFFKNYDCTLDFDASYMRDRVTQEAWLFLNHLCAMIAMDCLGSIMAAGIDKNVSLKDLLKSLQKITAIKIDGTWRIPPIKRKVSTLLDKLGVDINEEELEATLSAASSCRSIP